MPHAGVQDIAQDLYILIAHVGLLPYLVCVETDKGDVPIQKEYFYLWKTQRVSYMEYVFFIYLFIYF